MLLFHRALRFGLQLWLQLWPRSARFFVLALALLQFVAPTWHVCEMGGHVAARHNSGGVTGTHHENAAKSATLIALQAAPHNQDETATRKPLICFCVREEHAPKETAPNPNAPHLENAPHSGHATCLALLLQSMPGAVTASPALIRQSVVRCESFVARHESAPQIAILRRFRGRAPPVFL